MLQDIFALNAAYNRFYELNVALMMRLTLLAAKEASAAQIRSRGGSASACYRKCPGPASLVSSAAVGPAGCASLALRLHCSSCCCCCLRRAIALLLLLCIIAIAAYSA